MPLSHPPGPRVIEFQKAMVFIDGTNLFYRLASARLRIRSLSKLCSHFAQGRQILRTYLYTSEPHYQKAREVHGEGIVDGVRVIFGDALLDGNGNFKEKGVDALLVADLIYHAAMKNYDYAILISTDQDFAHALTRVEDFGCRTAVFSICVPAPKLLKRSCDEFFEISESILVSNKFATRL